MKKSLHVLMAAGIAVFVACGPSAEEKARMEQATLDSIEQVRISDSTMAADAAGVQQAMQDSIAMADSLAMVAMQDSLDKMKANVKPGVKPKPKADPKPTKPEDVKPGQGRG